MSRLPINLPSARPGRSGRGPARVLLVFCLSFAAVFVAVLLAMEMMLG